MRKIKFRGYDTRDGVREMVTFTLDELLAGTDEYELVDPDSVAQFIGYDRNGKEIYSDDKILSPNGLISEVSAMLLNPEDLQNFELVEK